MDNLKAEFWKYFKEISDIPRRSGEELAISNYVIEFAEERGLKYYTDDLHNVVVWKEASEGLEYEEILGLQCHMDMICEKRAGAEHDFSKDPIELTTDGDFLKAVNTTLGADNGIGVAYILAILDSKKLKTPKLECIFTVQEETTMNGAIMIDGSILKSKRIISFDNFNEDEMWIGSASAKEWNSEIVSDKVELNANNYSTYSLKLSNFTGGHSGMDIGDATRGNPIKLVSELLKDFSDIYIHKFSGGTAVNVIPRNCEIVFSINNYEVEKIKDLEKSIAKLKKNYSKENFTLEKDTMQKAFNKQTSRNILDFIYEYKNGALEKDQYGNIILSGNYAGVETEGNTVKFAYSIRDNYGVIGKKLEDEVKGNMKRFGISEDTFANITGYEQNDNNKLIKTCEKEYLKCMGKEIRKVKVQACLECGFFSEKIPNLQFIAIAPNVYDTHSPNERISIKSANKMWNFITRLIENN